MSAKCMDKYNRWRSKTVGFRVSPEEDAVLEASRKPIRSYQAGLHYEEAYR